MENKHCKDPLPAIFQILNQNKSDVEDLIHLMNDMQISFLSNRVFNLCVVTDIISSGTGQTEHRISPHRQCFNVDSTPRLEPS